MDATRDTVPPMSADAAPRLDNPADTLMASAWVFAQSWSTLLQAEMALARRSLNLLLFGAVALPVVALGVWIGSGALLALVIHAIGCSWLMSVAVDVAIQLALLALLLRSVRQWWRNLTLPRSRAALMKTAELLSCTPHEPA